MFELIGFVTCVLFGLALIALAGLGWWDSEMYEYGLTGSEYGLCVILIGLGIFIVYETIINMPWTITIL